jgi:VanZ family protein
MLQRLAAVAAWVLLGYIAFATLGPISARPTLCTPPIYERMAAFFVFGALLNLAHPRQLVLVCLIVVGSAVMLELAQLITPDRHGRILDALEKIAGGGAGIVISRVMLYFGGLRFAE